MTKLSSNRLGRALGFSKLGAKVALGQSRALFSRNKGQAYETLAETLLEELGQMKGLPMKIGQLLSYMEVLVPDEHREMFQRILSKLRTNAQPMNNEVCLAVFEEEIGRSLDEVFDRFDDTPIASASIGQVYRAKYQGQEVCVKIQYPGIVEATQGDLKNIDGLVKVVRTLMPNIDTRQMIQDFQVRLVEECDYAQEARYQKQFHAIYSDDPDVIIPIVVDELSTEKILTTQFIDGMGFSDFLPVASQEERNLAGVTLFRLAFNTLLKHGLFHADPHPGNILLRSNGTAALTLLDFGCVQPVDENLRDDMKKLLSAAIRGEDIKEPLKIALGFTDIDDATLNIAVDLSHRVLAPLHEAQPFRFNKAFAMEISKSLMDAKFKLTGGFLTRKNHFALQRDGIMFVVRNLYGLAGIWGELEAEGHFQDIIEEAMAN